MIEERPHGHNSHREGKPTKSIMDEFGEVQPTRDPKPSKGSSSTFTSYYPHLLSRFTKINTFEQMNPFGRDSSTSHLPLEIAAINQNYGEIEQIIENCFEMNINTYILLMGGDGYGKSSSVYRAIYNLIRKREAKRAQLLKGEETKGRSGHGADNVLGDVTNNGKVAQISDKDNQAKSSRSNHSKTSNSQGTSQHQPSDNQARPDAKPSAMQYDNNDYVLIEVDAFIYNQESKILNYISNEMQAADEQRGVKNQSSGEQPIEGNSYTTMTQMFERHRTVIYIKNIDVFTEESRQVFLYTFLDNINNYSMRTALIFSTSNLFFLNRLEKRVKSRFSFKSFIFDGQEGLPGVLKVIESRAYMPEHEAASKIIMQAINSDDVKQFLERYVMLGMSIGWFVNLFKTAFLLTACAEIIAANMKGPKELQDLIIDKLQQAKKMLLFEGGDADILRGLSRPCKLIMLVLHDTSKAKGPDPGISYETFKRKMREVIQSKFANTISKKQWENYSDSVLKEGLVLLRKMNYVHLDKTPVTVETMIQLNDSVSQAFLTVKVEECDIVFE